eukprot:7388272-Alexandrium_andersonii.AAC.1
MADPAPRIAFPPYSDGPPLEPPSERPELPHCAVRSGISANNGAERTPQELRGSRVRLFLGLRS